MTPAPASDAAARVSRLGDMIRIRVFEERCAELYGQRKIRGFLHLYIGEEAIAAGVIPELEARDSVVATYREHAHALVRGVSARSIMAEMFGKAAGCSGGRGGSMHLFSVEHRFFGGNAIVGGHLPLAAGLALADTLGQQRISQDGLLPVTVCFFGEGAVAEGEFHEAMNLAALWQLPVLFVCENNLYAMGTSLRSSESQPDLALKASSYRMAAWSVDGMDVDAVSAATRTAVVSIRAGGGPVFLEFRTYRFRAHSMFDPDLYRDEAEIARWKERDPIVASAHRLQVEGVVTEREVDELWQAAADETADAVDFADQAELEPLETLTHHVRAQEHPSTVGGGR